MSAFLGPIHYWLYNKIKFQNDLANEYIKVLSLMNLDESDSILSGNLEEIIDPFNIHGWLQEKVILVEKRLAYVVSNIKDRDESELQQIAFQFGKQVSTITEDSSVNDVFKMLNNTLLDGMPCDHINEIILEEKNKIIWKRTRCIHHTFWEEYGLEVKLYYLIRKALILGMIDISNITFSEIDETTFQLERR